MRCQYPPGKFLKIENFQGDLPEFFLLFFSAGWILILRVCQYADTLSNPLCTASSGCSPSARAGAPISVIIKIYVNICIARKAPSYPYPNPAKPELNICGIALRGVGATTPYEPEASLCLFIQSGYGINHAQA